MEENKPKKIIDADFIILSFLLGGVFMAFEGRTTPADPINSIGGFIVYYIAYLIAYPLFALWFKSFWNKVIIMIFPLKEINYWLSLGLTLFLYLFL